MIRIDQIKEVLTESRGGDRRIFDLSVFGIAEFMFLDLKQAGDHPRTQHDALWLGHMVGVRQDCRVHQLRVLTGCCSPLMLSRRLWFSDGECVVLFGDREIKDMRFTMDCRPFFREQVVNRLIPRSPHVQLGAAFGIVHDSGMQQCVSPADDVFDRDEFVEFRFLQRLLYCMNNGHLAKWCQHPVESLVR